MSMSVLLTLFIFNRYTHLLINWLGAGSKLKISSRLRNLVIETIANLRTMITLKKELILHETLISLIFFLHYSIYRQPGGHELKITRFMWFTSPHLLSLRASHNIKIPPSNNIKWMRCKTHHANSQARSNLPTAFIYSSKFSVWIRFHVPTAKSAIVIFLWLEYVSYSSSTAHSTGTDKTCTVAEKTEWKPGQSICRSLKQAGCGWPRVVCSRYEWPAQASFVSLLASFISQTK